jgi:excisionase family DNA binding protein
MNKRARKRRSPRGKAQFIEASGIEHLPPSLTIAELAALLGMSRVHIWRQVQLGNIRANRLGKAITIPRPEAVRLYGGGALPAPPRAELHPE